jgi:hypothetical protein
MACEGCQKNPELICLCRNLKFCAVCIGSHLLTASSEPHRTFSLKDPELPIFANVVTRILGKSQVKKLTPHSFAEAKAEMKERLSKELRLLEQFTSQAAMTIEAEVAKAQLDLMEARTRLTQSVDHQADAVSREIVKTHEYLEHCSEAEFQAANWPLIKLLKSARAGPGPLHKMYCGAPGLNVGRHFVQEFHVKVAQVDPKMLCKHDNCQVDLQCSDTVCKTSLAEIIIERTEGKVVTNPGETGYKQLRCEICSALLSKLDFKMIFGYVTYKQKKAEAMERSGLAYLSVKSNASSSVQSNIDSEVEAVSMHRNFKTCSLCRLTKPTEACLVTDCSCNKVVCSLCTRLEVTRSNEPRCPVCWKELSQTGVESLRSIEEQKDEGALCLMCNQQKPVRECVGLRCCRETLCRHCLVSHRSNSTCFKCNQGHNDRDLRDIQRVLSDETQSSKETSGGIEGTVEDSAVSKGGLEESQDSQAPPSLNSGHEEALVTKN